MDGFGSVGFMEELVRFTSPSPSEASGSFCLPEPMFPDETNTYHSQKSIRPATRPDVYRHVSTGISRRLESLGGKETKPIYHRKVLYDVFTSDDSLIVAKRSAEGITKSLPFRLKEFDTTKLTKERAINDFTEELPYATSKARYHHPQSNTELPNSKEVKLTPARAASMARAQVRKKALQYEHNGSIPNVPVNIGSECLASIETFEPQYNNIYEHSCETTEQFEENQVAELELPNCQIISEFNPANHHSELLASILSLQPTGEKKDADRDNTLNIPASVYDSFAEPSFSDLFLYEAPAREVNAKSSSVRKGSMDVDKPWHQLIARQQYRVRSGLLWESARCLLESSFLHPAHLTESEFVHMVCGSGSETSLWLEENTALITRRAVAKWVSANERLIEVGISPSELDESFLDVFEWMDEPEQANFIQSYKRFESMVVAGEKEMELTDEDREDYMALSLSNKYEFIKAYKAEEAEILQEETQLKNLRHATVESLKAKRAKELKILNGKLNEMKHLEKVIYDIEQHNARNCTSPSFEARNLADTEPSPSRSISKVPLDCKGRPCNQTHESPVEPSAPSTSPPQYEESPERYNTFIKKAGEETENLIKNLPDAIVGLDKTIDYGDDDQAPTPRLRRDSGICFENSHFREFSNTTTKTGSSMKNLPGSLRRVLSTSSVSTKIVMKTVPSTTSDLIAADTQLGFLEPLNTTWTYGTGHLDATSEIKPQELGSRNELGKKKSVRKKLSKFFGSLRLKDRVR